MAQVVNLSMQKSEIEDRESLQELWLICFDDSKAGARLCFDSLFGKVKTYTAKCDGEISAMLMHLPCTINGEKAHYLYGACTNPKFRGQGIMHRLIDFSLTDACENKDVYSVLLPSQPSLYDFYRTMDYVNSPCIVTLELKRDDIIRLANNKTYTDYKKYTLSQIRNTAFKNNNYLKFDGFYTNYAFEFNRVYGGKNIKLNNSYAILSEDESGCIVTELACTSESLPAICSEILEQTRAESFYFRLPYENVFSVTSGVESFGMIKPLVNKEIPQNLYIGLTLD